MQVSAEARRGPEIPGTGVPGICEPFDMGAVNLLQSPSRAASAVNY